MDVSPDPTFRECLDVSISRDLIRLKRSRLASIKYPKLPLLPGSSEGREYSELVVVRGSNYERTVASKAADLQEINWNREALPAGERALAKVGSFLAYMSLAPEERSEVPEMPTRQERPADDVQESDSSAPPWVRPGIRKITVVGFSPAALRRRVEQHESGELSYSHTRRGHFKSQPYGPNRSLRRVIWVEDVVVRPDLPLRPGHGHQYVVKKQAQTEAEMQDHDVEE
jgi:hypothetical protein